MAVPVGMVAGLSLALQPVAAMEQAIRVETPSAPLPGTPAIRPPMPPPVPRLAPREPTAPPRWQMVEEPAPSRWAGPDATGAAAGVPSPASTALSWELVVPVVADSPEQPAAAEPQIAAEPTWEPILPGEEITPADVARQVEAEEAARQEALAELEPQQPEPTFGGFRDLYRGKRWYPSISTIVPMGFGPSGFMAGIGFSGADCRPESRTCTRFSSVSAESIREVGEAVLDGYLGFGDSSKSVGVLITQTSGGTYRASERGNTFERMQTGFALSRNFGPDTALKLGAEGALPWDQQEYEQAFQIEVPKSAFAVISHRIRLKGDPAEAQADPGANPEPIRWFPDLYLTAGLGNGVFRPSDAVIRSQIREVKRAGCWNAPCTNERVKRALTQGTEWGTPYPIGAIALAITDQLNLITEWTGRNLNLSVSIQPFRNIGFTITPGIGNLVRNSDYNNGFAKDNIDCQGCDFGNAVTDRPIFYLRSMISFRF
ncbi:MAG: hypothetical protein KFB97_11090 [Cyanobium sp. M30B3]|nr:MAG: hypothetical protein KFB97_11090 [Cyanobium sp. M30B3]